MRLPLSTRTVAVVVKGERRVQRETRTRDRKAAVVSMAKKLAVLFAAVLLPRVALAGQGLVATMTGTQEVPATSSTATGQCWATVDPATDLVTFSGRFSGLSAPVTGVAVHATSGPGNVAPAVLAQAALTSAVSGTFSGAGTLRPAVVAGVLAGKAYCELDSTAFPQGEIRGQLALPSATPALSPACVFALLSALGTAGLVALRTRGRFHCLETR